MILNYQKEQQNIARGYDFFAIEDVTIPPYKIGDNPILIPTGIKARLPKNEFLMIVNRSSNPKKKKLVIPNSIGIIDSDYYNNADNEGEIGFLFYNLSDQPVEIKKGEKLGQGKEAVKLMLKENTKLRDEIELKVRKFYDFVTEDDPCEPCGKKKKGEE